MMIHNYDYGTGRFKIHVAGMKGYHFVTISGCWCFLDTILMFVIVQLKLFYYVGYVELVIAGIQVKYSLYGYAALKPLSDSVRLRGPNELTLSGATKHNRTEPRTEPTIKFNSGTNENRPTNNYSQYT